MELVRIAAGLLGLVVFLWLCVRTVRMVISQGKSTRKPIQNVPLAVFAAIGLSILFSEKLAGIVYQVVHG